MKHGLRFFFALFIGLALLPAMAQQAKVPDALWAKIGVGTGRVIAEVAVKFTPEGELEPDDLGAQRAAIAQAQSGILAELSGTDHTVTAGFRTIPFLGLDVGFDALLVLAGSDMIVTVSEDMRLPTTLVDSVPVVEADQTAARGFDGSGSVIVILDTGVQADHPFLDGKIVAERCFSGNDNCPNGAEEQSGTGAGAPCTYAHACRHGTHVAGIAAGAGGISGGPVFDGVASGADLISMQVFSRFSGIDCDEANEDPCALTYTTDQIKGLEAASSLRTQYAIRAVNMSLGGGLFTSNCDSVSAGAKAAIDNLRSHGIATVAASGNAGSSTAIARPACISSAISVGATTLGDSVSNFSNVSGFLSLFAPGVDILSSVPTDDFIEVSGTSMATPHVAGAWAILKQQSPIATVGGVLALLRDTGVPVTDPLSGVTIPRIQIAQALDLLVDNIQNGDINVDGCVSRTDLEYLVFDVILSGAKDPDLAFDLNGDNRVNIADARKLALMCTVNQCAPCP